MKYLRKHLGHLVLILIVISSVACGYQAQNERDTYNAVTAIVRNQPLPNLGGFSFEREVARTTLVARNRDVVATYTYLMVPTVQGGQIIEICASLGYPIPYGVQLTAPNLPEPNGLYSPGDAAATWVNCVNDDGTVTPTYFEDNVFALPYRIKADRVLEHTSQTTLKMNPRGGN